MRYAARGLLEVANAGHIILAPTAELSAALADAVERLHVAAGDDIWPTPHIRDYAGWLRERHVLAQLNDASLPRVLSEVEERELWRAAILDTDAGAEFLEPAGAARSARRARRALYEYGIPVESLAESVTDESTALLQWNRRFEARCRALDCITVDELQFDDGSALGEVCWIDSELWHPTARRRLQRTRAPSLPALAIGSATTARRVLVNSPEGELAAIAEWARGHLASTEDFRAWICIPDLQSRRAAVLDAFDAALAPHRFSLHAAATPAAYAVAGGTPLAACAPVRVVLDALAAATERVSFADFSALLRRAEWQPDAAALGAVASLDVKLRARGRDEATLQEWLALATSVGDGQSSGNFAVINLIQAFVRALGAVRGAQPLSRWAAVWAAAFDAGPWAQKARWSSAEFQAAERLRELMATLATADNAFGTVTAGAAARILARAAADTPFQPKTGIPPIWVTGQLMDPWLAYDGVWVAGLSEERWPPPIDPLPLLPVSLQRRYGVIAAGADSQLQRAEDLQRRWAARAPLNVFSCADAADGRTTSLSQLLPAAPGERLTTVSQPHWHALRGIPFMFESLIDDHAPAFDAPERTRGIATLRAQSRCPFRGYAETRLGTEALEQPQPGFNVRERGEMLHHALEFIWTELTSSTRLADLAEESRRALVAAAAVQAVETQCARRDPGARWIRREVPRLSELLLSWLDTELKREAFVVEHIEQPGHIARHGGLEFNVRIDRIDRLADGSRVLIDYKSGVTSPDWRGERPDNPQLPVYALLLPQQLVAVAYGSVNASACTFVAETARGGLFKPGARPSALEGMPSFAALIELWSQRIEHIATEFAAGLATVTPTAHACASCTLHALCRIPSALDDTGDA